MNSILAFPVYAQQPGAGAGGEHTVAMDLFVLINLAFLMFMLGFFACWAWLIWRRTTKPPPHIQLIMELDDQEEAERKLESPPESAAPPSGEPERAPWEREQDWWKK
ncbi:MAG: hypothetical protein V4662_11795 [Verrucomicrobiota bacterium]